MGNFEVMDIKGLRQIARRLGSCAVFTGHESEEELVELAYSAQGIEFCTAKSFPEPSIAKGMLAEPLKYNFYIDAGRIALEDVGRCYLIGNTQADITIKDSTRRHEVIAIRGAKAEIRAFGYSVVFGYKDSESEIGMELNDKSYGRI